MLDPDRRTTIHLVAALLAPALVVATVVCVHAQTEVVTVQGNLPRVVYRDGGGNLNWTLAGNTVLWKLDGPFNGGVVVATAAAHSGSININDGGVSIRGGGFPEAKLHVGNLDSMTEPGEVRVDPGNPDAEATIHAVEKEASAGVIVETLKPGRKASLRLGSPDASFVQTAGGTYTLRDLGNQVNPFTVFPSAANVNSIVVRGGKVGLGVLNPAHPLQLANGARCTAGGVWTNASSRALKHDVRSLTVADARAAVRALEHVRYEYDADPGEAQLGFIAEDVPELVATNDRTTLSPMDFVAALTRVVQDQDRQLAAQNAQLRAQGEELARQRAAIAQLTAGLAELQTVRVAQARDGAAALGL